MTSLDFKIDLALAALFMMSMSINAIPKKYNGIFWHFIRNNYHKHIFLGALFGMIISTTFSGVPIPIQLFLTVFCTGSICTIWEWFWGMVNGSKVDYKDVYYGVGAALIAVICHM